MDPPSDSSTPAPEAAVSNNATNPSDSAGPALSVAASLSPTHSSQPSRHLASRTVLALGAKASEVTSSMKSSSAVFRYGFETVERLVSPARSLALTQWNTYGEPLLGRLDNTLDNAINAVASAPPAPSANPSADPPAQSPAPNPTAVPASDLQAASEREQKTNYLLYWDSLKARLMATQWFAKVDEILLQNSLVKAVTCKIEGVMRPAEMFFNTATEAFLSDGDSVDSFLDALRGRMGPAWDDRLVGPSRAFYSTAGTVKKLVGAGKFFGGAIQLGKQKLNSAIDGIIAQWDSALSRADDAVDTWLPDRKDLDALHPNINQPDDTDDGGSGSGRGSVSVSGLPDHRRSDYPAMPFDDEDDDDDSAYDSDYWDEKDRTLRSPGANPTSMLTETPHYSGETGDSAYGEDAELIALQLDGASDGTDEDFSLTVRSGGHMAGLSESDTLSVASAPVTGGKRHRPKAPLELAEKVTKRLRQRIPLVRELPAQLKSRLVQSQWFQRVDEILRENSIVQLMQLQMMAVSTALDNVVRPAEHFYNTAAQSFRTSSKSYQEFIVTLREQMGKAWDERLTKHAFSFFKSASQAAHAAPAPGPSASAPAELAAPASST